MSRLSTYFPDGEVFPIYDPAMMQFDGSTGYYLKEAFNAGTFSKTAIVARFKYNTDAGNKFICYSWSVTNGTAATMLVVKPSDDANNPSKCWFRVKSTTGTTICELFSNSTLVTGQIYSVIANYDPVAGTASFIIDGVDEDNTSATGRILTTGTIASGASYDIAVGALDNGTSQIDGDIGFFGFGNSETLNYSDFFDSNNNPIKQDETTWANSGFGSQPLFWNENGDMSNNKGSAGDMTANGTIVVADVEEVLASDYGYIPGQIIYPLPLVNAYPTEAGMVGWTNVTGSFTSSGLKFQGGPLGGEQQQYQEINLVNLGITEASLDIGKSFLRGTWQQDSWSASDYGWIGFRFYDDSDVLLSEVEAEAIATPNGVWTDRELPATIPADTRYVQVSIYNQRNAGTNTDGYLRDLVVTAYMVA